VEVDHGGFEGFVAEEVLDGAGIGSGAHGVGGEGVTQGVWGDAAGDAETVDGGPDLLGDAFIGGVPAVACADAVGGEEELPGEFSGGVAIFLGESAGELDEAIANGEITLMQDAACGEVSLQGGDHEAGEDGEA